MSVLGLWMMHGAPESKAEANGEYRFDMSGVLACMVTMVALQLLVTQGNKLGWTSPTGLGLLAATVVFGWLFFRIEDKASNAFFDFSLFKNATYTGATISNFLVNGTAGTLIVSLQLVQIGGDMNAQQAGFLTLGYAIAIIAFIRIGEKLLQRFGPRKPMIWGCLITGLAILLVSPGRQDNLAVREAAIVALGFNVLMVAMAIVSIMLTLPKGTKAQA